MTVAARHARLAAAVTSARSHGEPVTLPLGEVLAVVELPALPAELRGRGTEQGSRLALEYQEAPALALRTEDAVGLLEGDAVTVRAVEYLVVRLDPDGEGMTRVVLMRPGVEPLPHPEWRQWR